MRADVLVLDGRHLLYRTSDAFRDLQAEVDGKVIATGGIYGFLSVALRVHNRYGGRTFVAWEGRTNFRLKLYPSYKRRDERRSDDDLDLIKEMAVQEQLLIELLSAMGVRQFRGVDYEADDVIGTIAKSYTTKRGIGAPANVVIYTGDSDLRQLVGNKVSVVAPTTQGKNRGQDVIYDVAKVEERHGVPPWLLAQLKALAGDSSDNIPGVPGVGPKTAAALLQHYRTLRRVLKGAFEDDDREWPATPRIRRLVKQHVRDVVLYHKLTKIRTDAATDMIPTSRGQNDVVRLLTLYKFRTLCGPAELHGLMRMGVH